MTASERIAHWRANPCDFVRDNFGVEPDEWQKDALQLLSGAPRPRRRIGTKACTGPGKSAFLAWAAWYRLACFCELGEHPKGIALSITADNLRDNLWAELSKWQARSKFLQAAFTWSKERIYANEFPETWFLSARSFARDADAESIGRALSGLHSKYPFILLDETGEMPVQVARAAEQALSNCVDGAILAAGNPTSTSGLLYYICTTVRDQWDIITITADPDDPKRTPRVDKAHAAEQIRLHGRDNPWVMATILGVFPPAGFNALLSLEDVEAAMHRHLNESDYAWAQKRIGVDVARFGDDTSALAPRQGLRAFAFVVMRNARSTEVAARVAQAKARWTSEMELVDVTGGYGAGVVDALHAAGYGPIEVPFSGKAADPTYFNARSEMWFRMAEWVKKGGMLPNDPDLVRELTAPTFSFQGGKFRLEEKDQIKKRIGVSPDKADALACTFYLPDMPGKGMREPGHRDAVPSRAGTVISDWEPFGAGEDSRD